MPSSVQLYINSGGFAHSELPSLPPSPQLPPLPPLPAPLLDLPGEGGDGEDQPDGGADEHQVEVLDGERPDGGKALTHQFPRGGRI